jgi:hypothetical protein
VVVSDACLPQASEILSPAQPQILLHLNGRSS